MDVITVLRAGTVLILMVIAGRDGSGRTTLTAVARTALAQVDRHLKITA
jgi:septum formation inhibitor-activating ATPase MinD